MDSTSLYSIDNTQEYDVVSPGQCRRITVQEDCDSGTTPTADLRMKMPKGAVNPIRIPKGTAAIYTPIGREFFRESEVVGTIRVAPGNPSCTVQQVASMQI